MIEHMHLHVTGFDANGNAAYVHSGEVQPIEVAFQAGTKFWLLWGTPDEGALIGDAAVPVLAPHFPSGHGTRFHIVRIPPRSAGQSFREGLSTERMDELRREAEDRLPGLFDVHAAADGTSAAHATDTVDYVTVLEGQLQLTLEGGEERVVSPGHFVVQRGTRHSWSNVREDPATVVVITVAAQRERHGSAPALPGDETRT
jgi:quercetin dioxygenase-like cupin family protein